MVITLNKLRRQVERNTAGKRAMNNEQSFRADGSGTLFRYDFIVDGGGRHHVETLTQHVGGTTLRSVVVSLTGRL